LHEGWGKFPREGELKKDKYLPGEAGRSLAALRQVSGPHLYDVFAEEAD